MLLRTLTTLRTTITYANNSFPAFFVFIYSFFAYQFQSKEAKANKKYES